MFPSLHRAFGVRGRPQAPHLRDAGGGPCGVQADAEVGILHDGQRAVVAAHSGKFRCAAEQRLVAEQQLGTPARAQQGPSVRP